MDTKGFFASLFDISFSSLITTKVIKVLYVISLVVIGLVALGFTISAFVSSAALGVVTLVIIAPLFALLYAVWSRVLLEFIIVVFRIAEYTHELVELTRAQSSPAAVMGAAETAQMPPTSVEPPDWPGDVPPAPGP